jgi:hypothetical protein
MIGVGVRPLAFSQARIVRVAVRPSMTGICRSMSTRSKAPAMNVWQAMAPVSATVIR